MVSNLFYSTNILHTARKEAAASTKAASRQTKGAPSKGRTKAGAAAKTVLPGLAHLDFGFTFEVLRPSKKQKLTMFAFGQGDDGQFGLGPVNADGEEWDDELGAPTRSVPVDDLTKANAFGPQGLRDVFTSLSQSSFGIDSKGQLWSWGYNDQGQLARPTQFPDDKPEDKDDLTRERQSKPDRVEALKPPAFLATKVASGDQINAAVSSVGKVQIWGAYRVRLPTYSLTLC